MISQDGHGPDGPLPWAVRVIGGSDTSGTPPRNTIGHSCVSAALWRRIPPSEHPIKRHGGAEWSTVLLTLRHEASAGLAAGAWALLWGPRPAAPPEAMGLP